jgi:hypothetical protein
MSLHVHELAIASERRLLPIQAERGWRIEEAAAAHKRRSLVSRRQAGDQLRTALVRFGRSLQSFVVATRPANAPSA